MDEVDIDNVEDLNELEARLYAQIHHESTNEVNFENRTQVSGNAEDVFVATNTNRNLSSRYWTSSGNGAMQQKTEQSTNMIRNPFNAPNNSQMRRYVNNHQQQLRTESGSNMISNISENSRTRTSTQNNKLTSETTSTPEDDILNVGPPPSSSKENKKLKNVDADRDNSKRKLPSEKSNLKLNPVADWMKRKKNNIEKNTNGKSCSAKTVKNSSANVKQGLFSRQQRKLEKAKRIEEKKRKSKKAKNWAAAIANKINPSEIIDLDSDNESDSSDLVIIPPAPTPVFTVDDSTDEDEKDKLNIAIGHEENALDSTDVQLSSTTSSFIKPQEISKQPLTAADSDEKRLENSSRCTSPCSIQSSDDFIRNIDRVRLLSGAGGMADDEDLLVLTSDIKSLVEAPNISKQADDETSAEKYTNSLNGSLPEEHEENVQAHDTSEFAAPRTAELKSRSEDYRVDQIQFRALDVYESESDITDSVYSKGVNKSTVIRQIGSSSDEIDDISTCSQRTKRLRKRRASSSNKESDHNNEILSSSTEDENLEDDNKLLRTSVSYIAKGPAVESYKPRKRNLNMSSNSLKSNSAILTAANDHMSDTEFLNTLNNLAQGQEEEQGSQIIEETDDSESENVPTAREIAEKILEQHAVNEENESNANDLAIPKNILNDLRDVFEEIDQLDKTNSEPISSIDDAVKISDSSDSDREKNFFYPSFPGEEAQIIKYSPKNSTVKMRAENGSPIYNVIYIRGIRKPVGVGWNDEMCKFYTDSWNGEHLILGKVLQKMNPEKSLWKIYTEDRLNIKSNKRSNIKCTNCCEFGHMRSKCKRPRKPMICYMCGESGHYEPRCPNTICLRCGNKTQVFTKSCNACFYQDRLMCPICKIRGHSLDYCPDKWRRYHSTTEANVQPHNKVNYNPRRYCCICGARGHISDYCRSALRFSEYPEISSNVKSHEKSYNDVVVRAPYNGIAVNLMYEPCQKYKFDFVEQTSSNKYYGRFLKAVGMDFLFSRKRHSTTVAMANVHTKAKQVKRFSSKYEANPYLKAGRDNLKQKETRDNAPNQVQEISESGNTDQQNSENHLSKDVINVEEISRNEVEKEVTQDIQLNTINKTIYEVDRQDTNFKSPKIITTASEKCLQFQEDAPLILDSDSNYSFSEHFDVALNSSKEAPAAISITIEPPISEEISNDNRTEKQPLMASSLKTKSREMEVLPDFIPLIDSTEYTGEDQNYIDNSNIGISRKFVPAESDDDEAVEHNRRILSPLPELPCEAKIYLTHFHTKYLLSPPGNAFLVKTSRAHKLKARLDFTSIGHVLVVFGFPTDQDKFQRELLLKYRDLEDERNQRLLHSNINVPKRTYVLIKFLRENIIQLMSNLGNANYLFNRLQYLERQQTKSGLKLAEKVRRSLNMILIGQAGLEDGTMHLDKLLVSLKTLLNDVRDDVAPPELRSEIINHWKVIFSSYRHDNYQKLVDTYNNLISKSRLPQLNIDPVLLGQKVLDTSFSEDQKQKLETARTPALSANDIESRKKTLTNPLYEKNMKVFKRKQNTDTITTSKVSANTATPYINKTKTITLRTANDSSSLNIKSKNALKNTPLSLKSKAFSNSTPGKIRALNSTTAIPNKSKQSSSITPTSTSTNDDENKRLQKVIPPPPFPSSETRSTVGATIQKATDKWKSTCDTLLTEISSDKPTLEKNFGGKKRDCMIPSIFWSRESMRYLRDCIRLAAPRSEIVDKLKRVENKSKNGQLSYNDYLAVIQLHTALNVK